MSNNVDQKRVVTGKVRLSYVNLFTPRPGQNGGDPKYSVTLLIPKSDIQTKQKIDAAIQAAIADGVSAKWNGVRPPQVPTPLHDGDGVRPSDGMPFGEECKNHWVMSASSKMQPQVVDLNLNPILNQTEVYSGMYARVSINFFAYFNGGKKGIGCGLGNVQKLGDGEPLGGHRSAESDFGGIPTPQVQTPQVQTSYGQQPQYQQPQQPGYRQPQPQYQQPQQSQYQQYGMPMQPQQAQPQVQMQIDPITGQPIAPGGVMGI